MPTPGCVPFDIFGGTGSITPGDARLCRLCRVHDSSSQSLAGASASISGKLFPLPGGEVGLAAGAEYRISRAASIRTRSLLRRVYLGHSGTTDARWLSCQRSLWRASDAPIVRFLDLPAQSDTPIIRRLAERRHWKVGAQLGPMSDLRLRASYGTALERRLSVSCSEARRPALTSQLSAPLLSADHHPTGSVPTNCRVPSSATGYQQNNPPDIRVCHGRQSGARSPKHPAKGWVLAEYLSPAR